MLVVLVWWFTSVGSGTVVVVAAGGVDGICSGSACTSSLDAGGGDEGPRTRARLREDVLDSRAMLRQTAAC